MCNNLIKIDVVLGFGGVLSTCILWYFFLIFVYRGSFSDVYRLCSHFGDRILLAARHWAHVLLFLKFKTKLGSRHGHGEKNNDSVGNFMERWTAKRRRRIRQHDVLGRVSTTLEIETTERRHMKRWRRRIHRRRRVWVRATTTTTSGVRPYDGVLARSRRGR